jgi:hypothetical protein
MDESANVLGARQDVQKTRYTLKLPQQQACHRLLGNLAVSSLSLRPVTTVA